MKVLEIGTLNVKKGGPPFSLSRQMYGLKAEGIDSVCLMPPCPIEDIIDRNLDYVFMNAPLFNFLGSDFIPNLTGTLRTITDVDIIHFQGMLTYPDHVVSKYAVRNKMPFIIAPRGSLYRQALQNKWLKKKIVWHGYLKKDLNSASCIQATCIAEMEEIRNLGCKTPIAVVPNSYDGMRIATGTNQDDSCFTIGYMGRLNPRKHVEKMIYALDFLRREGISARLIIIGSEIESYEKFLKNEAIKYGLKENVDFTGFLKDEKKESAIRKCHIFAFPSDFENWGNVVSDVMVRGIPVIATYGMPWEVLKVEQCGWWIKNEQAIINQTLMEAYHQGFEELRTMGERARSVILENYSVEVVGAKLKELYTWILNGGSKPDFVYI